MQAAQASTRALQKKLGWFLRVFKLLLVLKEIMHAIMSMGNCQNYGPFLGPYYNTGPNTGPNLGDPTRDHNFDSSPHEHN